MTRRPPHFHSHPQSQRQGRVPQPVGVAAAVKTWFEQGLKWHQQGDLAKATDCYERVLAKQAKHADALHLLGVIFAQNGDSDRGIDLMKKALEIQPHYPAALNNLGNELQKKMQHAQAIRCYDQALELQASYAQAWANKGASCLAMGALTLALTCLDQAVQIDPKFAYALNNRGNVLKKLGRRQEALQSFDAAIDVNPQYAEAWSNRGVVLREMYQLPQAMESLNRALQINPSLAQAYSNRAHVEQNLGAFEQALASCEKAISLSPQFAQAHNNKGLTLQMLHQLPQALQSYETALDIDPLDANTQFNRALALLTVGDYAKGWQAYEWRWKKAEYAGVKGHDDTPLWLGKESLRGKRIVLFAEQGLGDTLQFCRWAAAVKAQGAHVVLEVPPPLFNVLGCLSGVDERVVKGASFESGDYACALMSLPLALGVTEESQLHAPPYLSADRQLATMWRDRLSQYKDRLNVGLVWNGGLRADQPELWAVNARRNIDLALLSQALSGVDALFVSLQKGEPAESALRGAERHWWPKGNLLNAADELHDFADTAAVIENLDLIISVDTSTAHLAAAMGKPVWLLNRYDSCWRWKMQGERSAWYASMRLYRQDDTRSWLPVLEQVAKDLAALVAKPRGF